MRLISASPVLLRPAKKLTAAGFNRLGQLDVEFVSEPGLVRINRLSLASANHVVDLSGTLELGVGGIDLVGHLDQDAALARSPAS